ncbi:hypothetical protein ES703_31913 [subsurface metagenome]
MFIIKAKGKTIYCLLFTFLVLTCSLSADGASNAIEDVWDPARYIGVDEIKPGMEAYCLTEYGAAGVEKFGLEVIDVVRDFDLGRDVILVKGTDERFIHTGPVLGCSGSPVYIEGRLAGALALAWTYSKDPLYGVTPIKEMLSVGRGMKLIRKSQHHDFQEATD